MGAEHSRPVVAASTCSPLTWRSLHCGALHYSSIDIALWPHLVPFTQWFTAQDARVLAEKLRTRTKPNMLTFQEFVLWLNAPHNKADVVLHQPSIPIRNDIMTPIGIAANPSARNPQEETSTLMLEMVLEHIFHTFTPPGAKLYALEFLAAMVVVSRAIWKFEDKLQLLLELFHNRAATATSKITTDNDADTSRRFKETDVAHLFLCVMKGVSKATIGITQLWHQHGLEIAPLAKKFARECVEQTVAAEQPQQRQIAIKRDIILTEAKIRYYIAQKPSLTQFLRFFAGEELRNPGTFAPLHLPGSGITLHERYRCAVDQQTHLYESLLQNYVTFEGRHKRRAVSAAVLIQSTWRRRCSKSVLAKHRKDRMTKRHFSALTLQNFVRQRRFAKVLEEHAAIERESLNGGMLIAGSGPCIPQKSSKHKSHRQTDNQIAPLHLIDMFKLSNVKIAAVTLSRTSALALEADKQTIWAWGKCIPLVYDDMGTSSSINHSSQNTQKTARMRLLQHVPTRLAYRFPSQSPVKQLACGLRHALALTEDGMVHSWGFNDHGQLGHGPAATFAARMAMNSANTKAYELYYDERDGRETEFLAQPTHLFYFLGCPAQQAEPIRVQQICCGDYYCMALSEDGDVFTWGEASEGQLGHGDMHPAYQVAFVDSQMLNSAYTFLSQPEPVLTLSEDRIIQVACRKNHSVALTSDSKLFEWGNWGKRMGKDSEHAFQPVENKMTRPLRLRHVSVGDHHMLGEGSSVWLTLAPSPSVSAEQNDEIGCAEPGTVEQEEKISFYLACATHSCLLETIEQQFCSDKRVWTCCIIDFDADDLEEGEDEESERQMQHENDDSIQSLWKKRVVRFALDVDAIDLFDRKMRHLRRLAADPLSSIKFRYEKLLNTWLHDHVDERLVMFPCGKPAGFYVQFLLSPRASLSGDSSPIATRTDDSRDEVEEAILSTGDADPSIAEFFVYGSNTPATQLVTKCGFATHIYHPAIHNKQQSAHKIRRSKKKSPSESVITEENSLYLLEFNETCLNGLEIPEIGDDNDVNVEIEWSAAVVNELALQILAAQEAGVLAVLVVLDLFNSDPFELTFALDSGIYIPVFMVKKHALAMRNSSNQESRMRFEEVVEQLHSISPSSPTLVAAPRSSSLLFFARCFRRAETLSARIDCAFANGASGVILTQEEEGDANDEEVDASSHAEATLQALLHSSQCENTWNNRFVAVVSYDAGEKLHAASHIALCPTFMPLLSHDGCHYEHLVDVQLTIRAGGTTYAWGNGENGRLGFGSDSSLFQDGYEALTDAAYRFVSEPTRIPVLAGRELKQLVCGSAHSLAVTTDGSVFAWGKGVHGELAQQAQTQKHERNKKKMSLRLSDIYNKNSYTDRWSPHLVEGLRYMNIVQADANDKCSAFLTEIVSPTLHEQRRKEIAQLKAVVRKSLLH